MVRRMRTGVRNLLLALGIIGVLIPATACGGGTNAAKQGSGSRFNATSTGQVCTKAQKEGELNVRKTTDADVFNKEVAPFKAKYPDIKIRFVSQRPDDVVQQIVTADQAGKPLNVDVIDMSLDSAAPLFDRDLMASVDWGKLGISQQNTLTVDGVDLYRTEREIWGLVYNKNAVSASQLPSTWEELATSKWAGKIVIDPRASSTGYLAVAWGRDKAVQWYDRLLDTKPLVVEGETSGLLKVASGEAQVTTSSYDATVREQQQNGAPVAIKYLDVVAAKDHYAGVMTTAQHPNAAMCFLAWYGSKEGQAQQLKYEFKNNIARPDFVPADSKFVVVDTFKKAKLANDVSNELSAKTVSS